MSITIPTTDDDRVLRYVEFDGAHLLTWDTYRRDEYGKHVLGYAFWPPDVSQEKPALFVGEDFHNAPGDAIDSDESLRSLICFLTLRPGDTDPEYFDDYTPEQLAFAEKHGEELSLWSMTPENTGDSTQETLAFRDLIDR